MKEVKCLILKLTIMNRLDMPLFIYTFAFV